MPAGSHFSADFCAAARLIESMSRRGAIHFAAASTRAFGFAVRTHSTAKTPAPMTTHRPIAAAVATDVH